jgi:hypothetical protein
MLVDVGAYFTVHNWLSGLVVVPVPACLLDFYERFQRPILRSSFSIWAAMSFTFVIPAVSSLRSSQRLSHHRHLQLSDQFE